MDVLVVGMEYPTRSVCWSCCCCCEWGWLVGLWRVGVAVGRWQPDSRVRGGSILMQCI